MASFQPTVDTRQFCFISVSSCANAKTVSGCFSVLFQGVRTSEIKTENKIVLFQFYFTMWDGLYRYDVKANCKHLVIARPPSCSDIALGISSVCLTALSQAARPATSMGKGGFWPPVDLKPHKILLQKLDVLIASWGATRTPIFTAIGPGVSATQIAEI